MKILDGKKLAAEITEKLKEDFSNLSSPAKLIIFQVGDNEASTIYINFKLKKAKELGVDAMLVKFSDDITEQDLIKQIQEHLQYADAAIVQLPLPKGIDKRNVLNTIPYNKDVDGLAWGNDFITPATPRGIMLLMERYGVDITGAKVGVVGQSRLVGKPVADLCEIDKTTTVSRYDLSTGISGTENNDILIVAAGQANLIKDENIKEGAVLIDVGINEIADENAMKSGITGDIDIESVSTKPSAISPVPGGVGPMTVISLFLNLYDVVK